MGVVTDPALIAELNDRAKAGAAGVDYDKIAQSSDAKANKQRTGSVFGDAAQNQGASGFGGFIRGLVATPVAAAEQALMHGGNAVQRMVGMDPNKGMMGGDGMFSDANVAMSDAAPKVSEQQYQRSRQKNGRAGFDVGRTLGEFSMPVPAVFKGAGVVSHLLNGAAGGTVAGALQPTDTDGGDYGYKKAVQALTGAGVGGVVGGVLGKAAEALTPNAVPSVTRSALDAADHLNIPVGVGQVTDNNALGRVVHLSANAPGGQGINRAAQNTIDTFGQRAKDAAAAVGDGVTRDDAGYAARTGLSGDGGFVDRFQQNASKLYNRVNDHVSPDHPIDMTGSTISMLGPILKFKNQELGDELANPKLAKFARIISGINKDGVPISSTPNQLTFQDAQALRSEIGSMMGNAPAINDIPRAQLAKVYAAITGDIRSGISTKNVSGMADPVANPQALQAWDRATNYYQAGRGRIDGILDKVLGPDTSSNENIADRITSMVKNNANGVATLKRSLQPEEWNTVASSMLANMGKAAPGQAGEHGTGFSTDKFLTDFNKLRQNPKAFDFAFGGTPYAEQADTYSNLAKLSSALKNNGRLANHSGSGYHATLTALVLTAMHDPAKAAAMYGANRGFAYSMSNPAMARWMLDAGHTVLKRSSQAAELASKAQLAKFAALGATNQETGN